MRKVIFGGHVSDYMKKLSNDDPKKYKKHFSRYIQAGITAANLESTIKKVHDGIRADPKAVKVVKKKLPFQKKWGKKKLPLKYRKQLLKNRISDHDKKVKAQQKLAAAAAPVETVAESSAGGEEEAE